MTDPKKISILDYSYSLPEDRIASFPLPERDVSQVLVYNKGEFKKDIYKNITDHIPKDSLIVFNNTKVVEARLLFQKPSGGIIEIFCLEPTNEYADISTAMSQHGKINCHCLIGGASKWKKGQLLEKKIITGGKEIVLVAKYIEKRSDTFIIALNWTPGEMSFAELLHNAGAIPLPPYIKRKPETSDLVRYQTIYAAQNGSVAAPTAGLHFTTRILNRLEQKKIDSAYVTLHVGAGTFKPVKAACLKDHDMHAEFIEVSKETIQKILSQLNFNIIAVGTTSLRTIESLYWLGIKLAGKKNIAPVELLQWEAYDPANENFPVKDALTMLLDWMHKNKLENLIAKTQLLIAPGYSFKIVNALITNFHQPHSTLLLLVAAFVGDKANDGDQEWKKIYNYALSNDFRFLSYGDGSLLWRNGN